MKLKRECEFMNNCEKLREMIMDRSNLSFIMESHNGLSAKIAVEAGFKAIWASGLSMSASEGVRDNNELSFTEVAKRCEVMCQAVPDVPVLLDYDSGYGSFNTAVVALRHMLRAGIAGLVIEDKKFPKLRNSLHENSSDDELADVDEHALKIKALRDEADKYDKNFVIVARLESFLANKGLDDALMRAHKYVENGADAILVHSKKLDSNEIDAFMNEWNQVSQVPVIIVPTKYYRTPTDHFRELGISAIIWANHQMRASISAMQNVTKIIHDEESLVSIEQKIAPVSEVFRLQNNADLEAREKIYFPKHLDKVKVLILAASRGNKSLKELTENYPKCMIPIGRSGKSTIDSMVDSLKEIGLNNIYVAGGYKADSLRYLENRKVKVIDVGNTSHEVSTTYKALKEMNLSKDDTLIVMYGDCIYHHSVYMQIQYLLTKMMSDDSIDVYFSYTNRVTDDALLNPRQKYYAGITIAKESFVKVINRKSEVQNSISKRINNCNDLSLAAFSIPKDSWCDINDITDLNKGIELL